MTIPKEETFVHALRADKICLAQQLDYLDFIVFAESRDRIYPRAREFTCDVYFSDINVFVSKGTWAIFNYTHAKEPYSNNIRITRIIAVKAGAYGSRGELYREHKNWFKRLLSL